MTHVNLSNVRQKQILLLLLYVLFISPAKGFALSPNNLRATESQSEDILAHVFLYTGWLAIPDIMSRPYSDLRNTLIDCMDNRCNNSLTSIQGLGDEDLSWAALMYYFLKEKMDYTTTQLLNMSIEDYRNTIISHNSQHAPYTISQLQSFSNAKNLNIAYQWWFGSDSDFIEKFNALNNISGSNPQFDKKDSRGVNMNVMRITLANDTTYKYLSVYHYQVGSNHFELALAGSNDLANWTFINILGDRSHQGDIKKWGDGYLLVNEQDPVEGSNNIRVRYYGNYLSLAANNASYDYSITRNFSTLAEGTPDIRAIEGNTPSNSQIVIGFHYYKNGVKDQLATGILYHFTNWRAWKNEISNYNISELGYAGNIGGRSAFTHHSNFVLQEAQQTADDWSSWRLLLGDGAFYSTLTPSTPKGSGSFANPGIADIGSGSFAVSAFLPTEGNQDGEKGELLYKVDFNEEEASLQSEIKKEEESAVKIVAGKNRIDVLNAENGRIRVYDFLGRIIYDRPASASRQRIDVKGMVIVSVETKNDCLFSKQLVGE
jgi:hypothetical protein